MKASFYHFTFSYTLQIDEEDATTRNRKGCPLIILEVGNPISYKSSDRRANYKNRISRVIINRQRNTISDVFRWVISIILSNND